MSILEGKRILFLAPCFFGYERDIRGEIERRGAVVDWMPDRPFNTPLMTALTKLKTELVQPAANRLYDRLLDQFGATSYDYILVVNGQTLSHTMLARLRSRFKNAHVILYMWDSIDNRRSVVKNLTLFDSVFSFDPQCAQSHGMIFRPLFYSKGFEQPVVDFEYQISFIGTAHTDRYAVVSELKKGLAPDINAFWYLYLQAPWVFHYYRATDPLVRRAKREEFQFKPIDKGMVQSVFARSRSILDIEHPKQRGLTMRTFETMGAGKKLITTNKLIENYDFFASGNVCVVDRKLPRLTKGFLETPFVSYPDDILYRYSLAGWVDEVFGLRAEV